MSWPHAHPALSETWVAGFTSAGAPVQQPDGGQSAEGWDRFPLSREVVPNPGPHDIQVYKQGCKEPHANIRFDQFNPTTIVNVVWTTAPIGGELIEICYKPR